MQENSDINNSYNGCLIGGAIGDSLDYSRNNHDIFKFSANTQLSLFTANGLLYGLTRVAIKGIGGDLEKWVYWAYKDWYKLQKEGKRLEASSLNITWLINVKELSEVRNPVLETSKIIENIDVGNTGSIKNSNNAYDCVSRVIPVGLCFREEEDLERIFDIAFKVAKLTHGDNNACLSSGFLASFIHSLRNNSFNMEKSLGESLTVLKHKEESSHLINRIENIKALLSSNTEDNLITVKIGNGATAEDTLLLGLYFSIKYWDDFAQGVTSAVKHKQNSSSVGFIVGSILGLINGEDHIPSEWKSEVEVKSILSELANDLYLASHSKLELLIDDEKWKSKYVEKRY